MAKSSLILLLISMFFSYNCFAQKHVSGRIIDEKTKEPVAGAFVLLSHEGTVLANCLSDSEGTFYVDAGNSTENLTLSISILGFSPLEMKLDRTDNLLIKLKEQKLSLKASRIKADVIKEEGDTLTFSAGAFKERSDRTLGELLERLPGIIVTKSGGILYNGSYINKFYIEGLDLMGANYGSVTKNFSLESVASIEVYKDHQPVQALAGLEHTGKASVNIVLKENAKGTWLFNGDAAVGAPEFPLFDVRTMLSRFSKKRQNLFLIKGNNIGNDITKEIQAQRYFGKTGAFLINDNGLDSDFCSSLNPRKSHIDLPNEFWYDNVSWTSTMNHLQKIKDDAQLRAAVTLGAENYEESRDRIETVRFEDSGTMIIDDNSSMTDRLRMGFVKLDFEKNNRNVYLSDEIMLSGQLRKNESQMSGSNGYAQGYTLPSFKIQNNLDATLRTSQKRAVKMSSLMSYVRSNHHANYSAGMIEASQSLDNSDFKNSNDISYKLRAKILDITLHGKLDIDYLTRKASLIGLTDNDFLTSERFNALMLKPEFSIAAATNIGKARVRLSIPFSFTTVSDNHDSAITWPELTPALIVTQRLTNNLKASANVSYTVTRSNPENLAKAAIMTDYRNIQMNGLMMEGDRINTNVGLNYANHVNMIFASTSAYYSKTTSGQARSYSYSENFTLSSLVPYSTYSSSYGGNADFSKYFGLNTLCLDFSIGYDHRTGKDFLQGKAYDYMSDGWSTSASMKTSALRWAHAEASVQFITQKDQAFTTLNSRILNLSAKVNLYPVRNLSLNSELFYGKQWRSERTFSNSPLIKCSIEWKRKKAALLMECHNLLDIKTLTNEVNLKYRTVSTITKLRGREYLAGIRMTL